jgi:predicted transcriptional regulator
MKSSSSFRLSEEAMRIIKALAELYGISQASVIEMALRKLAREEKIK